MSDLGALADEVQVWVDANWDTSLTVGEWWARLTEAGYAYPTWPPGLGGAGATRRASETVAAVLARNEVVAPPTGGVAAALAAADRARTRHTHPDQAVGPTHRHRRDGLVSAVQRTRLGIRPRQSRDSSEHDGDDWVVTGQKVWNSAADVADLGMLLARTDLDQPKHRGITYFVIDMHQPGIEVRPLRQMNGLENFCEVFLTDARVQSGLVLGDVNDGWRVAQTTLAAKRNSTARGGVPGLVPARSGSRGDLHRTVGDVIKEARAASSAESRVRSGALAGKAMIALARSHGAVNDPTIRQALARYASQIRINRWIMQRIGEAGGRLTGADGSIAKLVTARICQESRDLSYRIVGAQGMLAGSESPLKGELQRVNLASPGSRIGGGTDEIQLNVIAERGLDLPREPGSDRDVPYRDLRVGTQK